MLALTGSWIIVSAIVAVNDFISVQNRQAYSRLYISALRQEEPIGRGREMACFGRAPTFDLSVQFCQNGCLSHNHYNL
jgi:hypothetical protein